MTTPEPAQKSTDMRRYQCGICGDIYDPAIGDPDTGIPPGVSFQDLPRTWRCPRCGASWTDFDPID